jgi:hypothetical protein
MKLFTLFAIVLISWPGLAAEVPASKDTDWLMEARCGTFMHFLPADAGGLARVDEFDVPALARQLESAGARYFVITLGQNSGYFISPNAAYDRRTGYAAGERCARRDLPLDLARELKPKGIRLMLYLPAQTPNRDRRAQQAFGLREGPADLPRSWPANEFACPQENLLRDKQAFEVYGSREPKNPG